MQLTIPIPECQQTIRLPVGVMNWSEDEFFDFCQTNRNLCIERSAKGEILVMSSAGGYSGYQSGDVSWQLCIWATDDKTGVAFGSSTGFLLPNGGMRAPDAAWVQLSRLQKLSHREKEKFIPLCPDFLIEVASPSDTISEDSKVSSAPSRASINSMSSFSLSSTSLSLSRRSVSVNRP
jgi:Uma2 family endonuclease